MNRKIKFRGKLVNSKEWAEGNLCIRIDDTYIITPDETILGKYGRVFKNTIGQYTELHDKNGKEIYEGDIVRIIVNNNIEKICKVEFKNGIFGVMFSKNKELTAFPHFCNTTFEVIGNEYDNPELLGGE